VDERVVAEVVFEGDVIGADEQAVRRAISIKAAHNNKTLFLPNFFSDFFIFTFSSFISLHQSTLFKRQHSGEYYIARLAPLESTVSV
jgi:uncharacterized protein YciW